MGKHFWIRHVDDELEDKQPGCVWGLVHALDYHHWHSNPRKMIHHRKYEGQRQSNFSAAYGSPKTELLESGEVEKLLNDQESVFVSTKNSHSTNKRSLKAHIKALVAKDSKEEKNRPHKVGFSVPSRLQRTYSIHHLESADGGLHKIITDSKHPIIFLPDNGATQSLDTAKKAAFDQHEVYSDQSMDGTEHELEEGADVLEMFKVDKDLFEKTLKGSDKSNEEFSNSLLALNKIAKLSKSKSFPVADLLQRRKLKPSKLEHKKNEIWSFREGDKLRAFNQAPQLAHLEKDIVQRQIETISSGTDEYNIRKSMRTHRRSSSLNESVDKYASLFASSYRTEVKLHPSRSLKSINEYGHAPMYFRRNRSLSQVDYHYSDHKFGVLGNDFSADASNPILEVSSSRVTGENASLDANEATKGQEETVNRHMQRMEDDASLRLNVRDEDSSVLDGCAEEADDELTVDESDSHEDQVTNCSVIIPKKLPESETSFREMVSDPGDFQISEGLDRECNHVYQKNSPDESHDQKSLYMDSSSSFNSTLNPEKSGYADTNIKYFGHIESQKETDSDLYYVRHILEKSYIVENAFDITWHSSDQPLSPELFEEVETYWKHERSQLNGWPDFYGCWHHRLLFDEVNEVLLQIYDKAFPYYPKALSSSCRVRPMPVGNHFIEEVYTSIVALLNFKPEEMESLDSIVSYDLANDCSWMNLQLESETMALDLEDMIFDELLEEVIRP
ncbi:protein TRM32 [Abeliophyllum distichum]|uniref:Protein TRM32 n=1 Tax=Abeliophyllum distichum TaxID=126358 RepID=A0ABD1Q2H8_9LAMI